MAAAFGALTGAIGGAVSTCFFNTPALNRTAMKIVGLGALQGAVVQALGLGIMNTIDTGSDEGQFGLYLVSTALLTVAAKILRGTTYKEALAN